MRALSNESKAEVLTQALPYIQKYAGSVVVVKYGGNAMVSESLRHAVTSDIILLSLIGVKIVLVHGGGPEITAMLDKLGIESKFVDGLRYTDADTVDIVQMVLAGKTNKDLVALIESKGGHAIGLCGLDGGMIQARKTEGDLGFVGDITHVNTAPITDSLKNGYIPIIATIGADERGQVYNINADTAASAIAGALGAENIVMMTDVRGLMREVGNPESLIPVVRVSEVPALIRGGVVSGGMIDRKSVV
jgi:acetylglutamate kinase